MDNCSALGNRTRRYIKSTLHIPHTHTAHTHTRTHINCDCCCCCSFCAFGLENKLLWLFRASKSAHCRFGLALLLLLLLLLPLATLFTLLLLLLLPWLGGVAASLITIVRRQLRLPTPRAQRGSYKLSFKLLSMSFLCSALLQLSLAPASACCCCFSQDL